MKRINLIYLFTVLYTNSIVAQTLSDSIVTLNLDKIAQEMKEVVADMQSGMITPETRKRQERILSRLLDATRSMNERDYETKRESRSGQDGSRNSPNALDYTSQEGKTRALQELLRSIQQGYTKDYESLIRKYFESVQKAN